MDGETAVAVSVFPERGPLRLGFNPRHGEHFPVPAVADGDVRDAACAVSAVLIDRLGPLVSVNVAIEDHIDLRVGVRAKVRARFQVRVSS